MGDIPENQATLQCLVHNRPATGKHHLNMSHAMSKSSVFFPTLPWQPLSLSKSPDSDLPRPSPPARAGWDRGSTGTAKLATVINLMSCIGQRGSGSSARAPGPAGGLSRPACAPPAFKFVRSRYRAQPSLWH